MREHKTYLKITYKIQKSTVKTYEQNIDVKTENSNQNTFLFRRRF